MQVKIKKVHYHAIIPKYQTAGASGFDICSCEDVDLLQNEVKAVRTGLAFSIPEGYELQIRSRSGLAKNFDITVVNSPGTIDSDFRGEVRVLLKNTGGYINCYEIKQGDRIAQGVIQKVEKVNLVEVEELDETERGENGFGSTGYGASDHS